jgi:hypothetical protein
MNKLLKYLSFSYPQTSTESLLSHISKIVQNRNNSNNSMKNNNELININQKEISSILKFLRIFEFEEEISFMKENENNNMIESLESIEGEINKKIEVMIKKFEELKFLIRNGLDNNQIAFREKLVHIKINLEKNIEILNNSIIQSQKQSNDKECQFKSSIKFELYSQFSEDENLLAKRRESKRLIENIDLKPLVRIKNELFTDLRYISDFEVNNHLVVSDGYPGQCLIIFDRSTSDFIKTVNLNGKFGRIAGVCALNDKKQILVVDWTNTCLYLLDFKYDLIKEKKLAAVLKNNRKRWYEAITYNPLNEKIYLLSRESCSVIIFDKDLNELDEIQLCSGQASFESIKYFSEKLYVTDSENKCVYAFDADLKKKFCFGNSILECPTDILINEQFIFVLEFGRKDLKVFNASNYEFIKIINIDTCFSNNGVLVDNKLVINSDSKELHLYNLYSINT